MEHIYPGVFEPVSGMIENLIAFPARYRKGNAAFRRKQEENGDQTLLRDPVPQKERMKERDAALSRFALSVRERWDAGRIREIPLSSIVLPSEGFRRFCDADALCALADSIAAYGVLKPLTVRPAGKHGAEAVPFPDIAEIPAFFENGYPGEKSRETGDSRKTQESETAEEDSLHRNAQDSGTGTGYELLCGERRFLAAQAAGLTSVPCIVLAGDDLRTAELALIENLQGERLDMFEAAAALSSLIDLHALPQEALAKSLSVSQSCIANRLRLLKLTNRERELILSGHLTERHARAFLRLRDPELRLTAVRTAAEKRLTVAQTEALTEEFLQKETDRLRAPGNGSGSDAASESFGDTASASPNAAVFLQESGNIGREQTFPSFDKVTVKDTGLLCNTIEHAVLRIRNVGAAVTSEKTEDADFVRYVITLPR